MLPAVNTMQDVNVKDNLGRQKYWWQLSDSSDHPVRKDLISDRGAALSARGC